MQRQTKVGFGWWIGHVTYPHTDDHDEARGDWCLEETEKEAASSQAAKIIACSREHEHSSP